MMTMVLVMVLVMVNMTPSAQRSLKAGLWKASPS
jgi:hypothetical protein